MRKIFSLFFIILIISCSTKSIPQQSKSIQYPPWILNPFYKGYIGAVGVAKKEKNISLPEQKRIAIVVAQGHLSQIVKTVVSSEYTKIEKYDYNKKRYEKIIKQLSRQSSEAFLKHFVVKDEWIDPRNGDYYVWVVLEDH